MKHGTLVRTDIIRAIVSDYIQGTVNTPVVYDGAPRNIEQYKAYGHLLGKFLIFNLTIPRAHAIDRILGRRIDPTNGQAFGKTFPLNHNPETGTKLITRPDDKLCTIIQRIKVFEEETHPLLAVWQHEGIQIHTIDMTLPKAETARRVERIL